jgi:hypothetical protein
MGSPKKEDGLIGGDVDLAIPSLLSEKYARNIGRIVSEQAQKGQ